MCRIGAFIPNQMKREDILDILKEMEGARTGDSFGFCYVKNDEFVVKKTILSLTELLEKKTADDFFGDVFKHNSWVLFHSRKASPAYPNVCYKNAHPFESKNYCMIHNGLFKEAELVRVVLGDKVKYLSETDSEVGLHLFEKVGRESFQLNVLDAGVFIFLDKRNNLHVFKTDYLSDLKICQLNKRIKNKKLFLCSAMDYDSRWEHEEAEEAYYLFNTKGDLTKVIITDELKEKIEKKLIKEIEKKEKPKTVIIDTEARKIENNFQKNAVNVWVGGVSNHKSIHEMNLSEWKRFQMENECWSGCE